MGLQDGSIRIQPILLGDFASLHDYWMMGVHDSLRGYHELMSEQRWKDALLGRTRRKFLFVLVRGAT